MANKKYAFIILGVLGAIIQFTLLRELTFAVTKHEIAFTIILSTWLILSGLGSLIPLEETLLGKHFSVMLTLAFCWGMSACHLLPSWLGVSAYEPPSFTISALITLLAIGDSSWLIGAGFRKLCKDAQGLARPSVFFLWEASGFCIGGILWSIATIAGFNAFWWLGLCIFLPFIFSEKNDRRQHASYILLLISCVIVLRPMMLSRNIPNETILAESYGTDGHIMITRNDTVTSWRLNGQIVATNQDTLLSEQFIHTVFSAQPSPKQILSFDILSPTDVREIKKYPSAHVTLVSDSKQLFDSFFADKKNTIVQLKKESVTDFLNNTHDAYDIILLPNTDIPTLDANRFFTQEFFTLCKKHLNPNGILAFSIESNANILAPRIQEYDHCIYATLKSVFANTFFIPGDRMILIASPKEPISADAIIKRFVNRNIPTTFFTQYHLEALLDNFSKPEFQTVFDTPTRLNTDLDPEGFVSFSLVSQAKFRKETFLSKKSFRHTIRIFLAGLVCFMFIWIFLIKHPVFSTRSIALINGFLSFGAMAMILLLFQIAHGTLFVSVGVLCGIFMIGIASGNALSSRKKISLPFLLGLWIIWWGLMYLTAVYRYSIPLSYATFLLLSFCAGSITGAFYPALLTNGTTLPKHLYGWDNLGGFASGIMTTLILIPAFGILNSICILGGFAALLCVLFFCRRSTRPRESSCGRSDTLH